MGSRRLFPKKVAAKFDKQTAVIQSDARDLPLPDESVDLIVTSPPYFSLRSYRDGGEHFEQIGDEATPQEFVDALSECMVEWRRVLKPSGSVCINLGDKYSGSGGHNNATIGAKKGRGPSSYNKEANGVRAKSLMGLPWRFAMAQIDAGWILRAEVIWSKPNGLPESVMDRVRRSHEQWFHFVKEPQYYSAIDELREPHTDISLARMKAGFKGSGYQVQAGRVDGTGVATGETSVPTPNPLGKVPGSVWTVPTEPFIVPDEARETYDLPDHFAAFPQEWPRRIILGWSPSGICSVCGEGRKPKTGVTRTPFTGDPLDQRKRTSVQGGTRKWKDTSRTITGETCACDEPTASTTPAVVLDPFGGTGTVAGVARTLGRYGISNDLSSDYNRLAIWRIWESNHFEKSYAKHLAEKQVGQPSPLETYLMSFPGIGKVSARAIVDAVGNPFSLTSDITEAKGVGAKAEGKMRDALGEFGSWVTVDDGEDITS